MNRFFFGLKHLAPRAGHNPQIMSSNTLISLPLSLTGDEGDADDEDDSAQAESTRLQLANKRRCVFTPSSRKKTVCCLWCLRGWGRGEEGRANCGQHATWNARRIPTPATSSPSSWVTSLVPASPPPGMNHPESRKCGSIKEKKHTTPPPPTATAGCVMEQPQV